MDYPLIKKWLGLDLFKFYVTPNEGNPSLRYCVLADKLEEFLSKCQVVYGGTTLWENECLLEHNKQALLVGVQKIECETPESLLRHLIFMVEQKEKSGGHIVLENFIEQAKKVLEKK